MSDWVRIASLDQLVEGLGERFEVGEHSLAVFRLDDDVYVIGDRCSHAEASLAEGELWNHDVECPRHGSEFDLRTGEPKSLPATKPVPVYEAKVEGGDVYVLLGPGEGS